jgi:hypothetical protein
MIFQHRASYSATEKPGLLYYDKPSTGEVGHRTPGAHAGVGRCPASCSPGRFRHKFRPECDNEVIAGKSLSADNHFPTLWVDPVDVSMYEKYPLPLK